MNIYVTGAVLCAAALLIFKKSGCFFKSFLTSALGGVGALCAVSAVSYFVPLTVGMNIYTLLFSAMFSVPGVITLLVLKTFLL